MMSSEPPDEALVEKKRAKLVECLDYYESLLKKQSFLAGQEITLVDYFAAVWVPLMSKLGLEGLIAERPHFGKWWETVQERKAWGELTKWIQQ